MSLLENTMVSSTGSYLRAVRIIMLSLEDSFRRDSASVSRISRVSLDKDKCRNYKMFVLVTHVS